ncbi:hypothetical protein [Photobacterium sp. TY1-4]|uniref:hypothetical protein n=1 Tax=Photobacterium sp. TY1-4 TaxID=2899122 RepID=UPI0021C0D6F1|nr:hypothetical protein [Photobacterium sp. TY1-4]UXI03303.1 hypothetical protein NH461_23025 [Photobacterium sp. TY1-4]
MKAEIENQPHDQQWVLFERQQTQMIFIIIAFCNNGFADFLKPVQKNDKKIKKDERSRRRHQHHQ